MAVTADAPAPYAPTSVILSLIDRHRHRGLPFPVNADVLERAGVSPSLIPRTFQTLQTLELITEEGAATDTFEGIRRAPEGEYQQRLAEWLRAVYADAFTFVDPSKDDETAARDAFRGYRPIGQQHRMVSLFLGLCAAAGLAPEKPTHPRPQARTRTPEPRPLNRGPIRKPIRDSKDKHTRIPTALAGLLESLPAEDEGWSQNERDKFYATFGAVLDFCFPINADK